MTNNTLKIRGKQYAEKFMTNNTLKLRESKALKKSLQVRR
jgi:hypothetical protein